MALECDPCVGRIRRHVHAGAVWLALLSIPAAAIGSPRTLELYEEAAALTAAPAQGAKLFERHCAGCHGKLSPAAIRNRRVGGKRRTKSSNTAVSRMPSSK